MHGMLGQFRRTSRHREARRGIPPVEVVAIFLRDVSDVRVVGNEFIPSTEMAAGVFAIRLDDFRDVRLGNNSFWNWPGGPERAVSKTGESESRLDAEKNVAPER